MRVSDVEVGDFVLMRQKRRNKLSPVYDPKPYKVIKVKGPSITVLRKGKSLKRNISDIQKVTGYEATEDSDFSIYDGDGESESSSDSDSVISDTVTPPPQRRLSARERRLPVCY